MVTHIKILNKVDRKIFESPPVFSIEEQKQFFDFPEWAGRLVDTFRTSTNKVGFVLQLGYFRSAGKFFESKKFRQQEIMFVVKMLELSLEEIELEKYIHTTYERHQSFILDHLGIRKFDDEAKALLENEAQSLCANQLKPRSLFMSLVDFLRSKKIEVPSYYTLSEIITDALKVMEKAVLDLVNKHISHTKKKLLDDLLSISEEYLTESKRDSKIKRYKITLLKKSSQSTRPSRIRENIEDLQCLKNLFIELEPIIKHLDLTPELIQYYAQIVIKSQIFQIARRDRKRYLYLIAFVIHQYYKLNDLLVEALMQSVQTTLNTTSRAHKEEFYKARYSKQQAIKRLSQNLNNHLATLKEIESIINKKEVSDKEKVAVVKMLLAKDVDQEQIEGYIGLLKKESDQILKDNDYYDILESKSLKLQNRLTQIIKNLEFDIETSNKEIIEAINYFKEKDGILGSDSPLNFLKEEQRKIIFNESGKFRVSLYKVLLFVHISDSIKSGALNFVHSYKFRAFEEYLIPKHIWNVGKKELLKRAGLTGFESFDKIEPKLKRVLSKQFRLINENIKSGKNKYAKIDTKGNWTVSTPKKEAAVTDNITDLFPKDKVISVFEVLSTVNKHTKFLDCFEHHNIKYLRERPEPNIFFAGITGYGCNHGIRRIAKISRNINQNELEHTVNWHFTNENLLHANDKILELTDILQLPKLLKKTETKTHTSSDGQKYNIHVESLNANYSYKYFGKGKGVTVYVFLDETHKLFYSVVISSSESEAAYVIDGLMHNDVVQSSIHSTDTAGYSEIIFGVCHLLGISFAPRIRNFKDQQLYNFNKRSVLKNLGYQILPKERINAKIIRDNWDDILRFIATIKLRETPASQLFQRLSSYSRQHPLYKAMKEFGKIIKTLFLLKYIDNVELRQAIQGQLSKQENSNQFGKAVFHGNNQEFQQSTKEEQLIAEGCKRLIENAIICWNYLYLSKMFNDMKSEEKKQNFIQAFKYGSVVSWHHINMQGEYDFSDDCLKDSIKFELKELLDLKIA
jgi:TnpA family transposase